MKHTISIDFDGVIHAYSKGWQDGTIYDDPVPGAIEWIHELLLRGFDVVICSSRARSWRQRWRMREWLREKSGSLWYCMGPSFCEIKITNKKLPAIVYVDDRAFRYEGGDFPSYQRLRNMVPWCKKST